MSKNRRGRPQSEALSGIEGGIGLKSDGSLNIADPSLDPSPEARLARGELKIIDTEPVLTVKKRNPNSTLKAEDKKQAHEFLLGLEQQLNSALPSTTNVRQIVTKNGQDAKTDDARSHVRWGEDAFIDYFVVPTLFQVIQSAASLSEEDARHSLLSEHYRKIPQSKGTPARKELHPFTKVIGESPEAIMARWERVGGRPLKQACPDLALRAPFPHKIVFEAKYFIQTTLAAAENALVTDVFQTFFYRGLPMDDSRPSGPVWDYDYGCLLAYDGSDKGYLKQAWDSLPFSTREGFWKGANVYVMILRSQ